MLNINMIPNSVLTLHSARFFREVSSANVGDGARLSARTSAVSAKENLNPMGGCEIRRSEDSASLNFVKFILGIYLFDLH